MDALPEPSSLPIDSYYLRGWLLAEYGRAGKRDPQQALALLDKSLRLAPENGPDNLEKAGSYCVPETARSDGLFPEGAGRDGAKRGAVVRSCGGTGAVETSGRQTHGPECARVQKDGG